MNGSMVIIALTASLGVSTFGIAVPETQAYPPDRQRHESVKAHHEKTARVGTSQEVTFGRELRVGGAILPPGRYRLQHRVEGADHLLHFQLLGMTPKGFSYTARDIGDFKCRLEPLQSAARRTLLQIVDEEAGRRLIRVQLRGEDVAHVF